MTKALKNKDITTANCKPTKKRSIIPIPVSGKFMEELTKNKQRTAQDVNDIADEFLQWYVTKDSNLFFTAFFAARLISYRMIHYWKHTNPYFAECYELAEQIREQRLQERLITTTAPTGIIFLLKNLHGYKTEGKEEPDDRTPEAVSFEFTVIE